MKIGGLFFAILFLNNGFAFEAEFSDVKINICMKNLSGCQRELSQELKVLESTQLEDKALIAVDLKISDMRPQLELTYKHLSHLKNLAVTALTDTTSNDDRKILDQEFQKSKIEPQKSMESLFEFILPICEGFSPLSNTDARPLNLSTNLLVGIHVLSVANADKALENLTLIMNEHDEIMSTLEQIKEKIQGILPIRSKKYDCDLQKAYLKAKEIEEYAKLIQNYLKKN